MKTLTTTELILHLQKQPKDAPVLLWTPGQRWTVGLPFVDNRGRVLLEGNATDER